MKDDVNQRNDLRNAFVELTMISVGNIKLFTILFLHVF